MIVVGAVNPPTPLALQGVLGAGQAGIDLIRFVVSHSVNSVCWECYMVRPHSSGRSRSPSSPVSGRWTLWFASPVGTRSEWRLLHLVCFAGGWLCITKGKLEVVESTDQPVLSYDFHHTSPSKPQTEPAVHAPRYGETTLVAAGSVN